MAAQPVESTWDPASWRLEAWWCPSADRIVLCPGPCPDGSEHLLLPPCGECEGTGMINVEPDASSPGNFLAEKCPTCAGHGAALGAVVSGESRPWWVRLCEWLGIA